MRWVLVVVTSALVAGCSSGQQSDGGRTPLTVAPRSSPGTTTSTPTPTTTSTTSTAASTATAAPAAGADLTEVITWIENGAPAAGADYTGLRRDGATTSLPDGIAFSTDTVNCISTGGYRDGTLACLVDLDDPPPRPRDAVSVWKGNWVDFTGTTVEVGSVRGDPGPFRDGQGAALPPGAALSFGDLRCRAGEDAVLCVDYAARSAVRMSADGVDGFGCLRSSPPPPGIGVALAC